jgi:hypothetical protein
VKNAADVFFFTSTLFVTEKERVREKKKEKKERHKRESDSRESE